MSEYKTGTVNVTNGDATVVGVGTAFLTNVDPGDIFTKVGSGVTYTVGSVTDDTHLELTGNYTGATESGISYTISTGFTSPDNIAYPEPGDSQPTSIIQRAIMRIQELFTGIITGTQALTSPDINGGTADSLTSLTVAADSDGNVARWVMDTVTGGVGAEDGANTWAKIATFTGNGIGTSRTINKLIFESAAVHTDNCHAEIVVVVYDSLLATYGSIEVLNILGTGLSNTSFKLVQTTAGLGNPVELWVKKTTTDRKFSVTVFPTEDINNNTTIVYNNNATWQSAAPTGAVEITSDWAGSGQLTSTSLSNSTGTVYYEKAADGFVTVKITLATITTTTDGTTIFTMPVGYRHTFSGDVLEAPLLSPATAGNLPGRLRMSDAGVITLHSFDSSSTANWRTQFTYRARG